MNITRPIGARVLVEVIETEYEKKTESGLVLPGGPKKQQITGRVLKIGDGMPDGYDLVEGNIIFFAPGGAYGLDPNDNVKLVDAGSIYAVVGE